MKPGSKEHAPGRETDAPHTGARLETLIKAYANGMPKMPPTRGHDLKPRSVAWGLPGCRCPPHGGTT